LGVEINPNDFTYPPNSEMGDLALPCFNIMKVLKKSPQEIAVMIETQNVASVQAAGPYINIFFKREYLNKLVLAESGTLRQAQGDKAKVMIEYSQPNTHKEFHVGHLRNACLGAALVNIYLELGNKVIAANYIGDTGVHVAKCLWCFLKFHKDDKLPDNKGEFLGKIYAEASQKLTDNPELEKEVSEIHKKLEAGDKEITKLWQGTKEWSLDGFYDIYKKLGNEFDVWFWESEEEKAGKKIIQKILKDKKIKEIYESQGAVIADLKEYGLDVLVLIKSDGNVLYGTKDIPLGMKKFDKYKVDESIYIVDNRQSLYLKQVFKLLDLLGYENKKKVHIPYEFVTTADGAMASRKGNVITFMELYNKLFDLVEAETEKRHSDWGKKKVIEVTNGIVLAAAKFYMLKYDNNSLVVFDFNKAVSIEGDTGPYLLYTVARINSIFKKAEDLSKAKKIDLGKLGEDLSEKDLLIHLSKFEEIIHKTAIEYSPAVLCTYLIQLAHLFNNFYHHCPVLNAEESLRNARLRLSDKTREVLGKGLKLLNIESVEEM